MAVRHRLIKASPRSVWTVLEDGTRYAEWVVGTSSSEPVRGHWPELGSAIAYEVRLGTVRLSNETVVRRCVPGEALELEAKAGPLGTARIAIEVRPWGDHCLVIVDEHPLRGAGGTLHNVAVEGLIQVRHRAMLARLAHICEAEAAEEERRRPMGQVVAPEPGAGGARA
ncbi:polyketide cyclase [Streptomyces toyocaensis]|uniref:Polyketide cyclase n=1 Tax=Streptomyces toyocaensis TaxID=55952 RepID=A0A081XK25_STRTO|nr:SRPBCC family protein [Streptomyces toyocaensis]KES03898.1 polyketide cyclase [Streptomyces toyocaensis]